MLVLQPRDVSLLDFVIENYTVTLDHIHANVFPDNKDSRTARRRLGMLLEEGYVAVTRARVLTAKNHRHEPVYYPTEKAVRVMVERTGKLRYLHKPTREPYNSHLSHFVALTDLRLLIKAAAKQAEPLYAMVDYLNQFDTANAGSTDPAELYKLYTVVEKSPERTVSCVPDAAMAFRSGPYVMPFYLELERETTAWLKACKKKHPGYNGLFTGQLHQKHFPGALPEMRVLFVALHREWRDHLAAEFGRRENPQIYRFAALPDLTEESFFFDPVWKRCDGQSVALFPKKPGQVSGQGTPDRAPVPEAQVRQ